MSNLAFSIRSNEGCAPQPILTWDTVWDAQSGFADWAYADRSEASNRGGLQAQAALQTAVILCLFTDRYCPPDHPLAFLIEGDDPRGWWGDGVDVARDQGEAPLGSLLWLLAHAPLTEEIARYAQAFALEALSVLIGQQAVVRVEAQTQIVGPSRLNLAVQLYGRDGSRLYAHQFDDVWRQAFGVAASLAGGFNDGFSDGFG